MLEREFRAALSDRIGQRYLSPKGRLIQELALPHRGARVDIAVVDRRLIGFEIKTDADTLTRLPAQQWAYNAVFDRMYLAVEPRHLARALLLIPSWWGVLELSTASGDLKWTQRRKSLLNPAVDLQSLVQLLWREEVLDELDSLGLARGVMSAPRAHLWGLLASAAPGIISPTALKRRVRQRLIAREGWRAER